MKYRKNCIAALPMRPQVCCRPFATIKQSLTHKRTLIIIPKEKTLHSNISDRKSKAVFCRPLLLSRKVYLFNALS